MTNFVALYRGDTITDARTVAASCDPALVEIMTRMLLQTPPEALDGVFESLELGKRRALRLIKREAQQRWRPEQRGQALAHTVTGFHIVDTVYFGPERGEYVQPGPTCPPGCCQRADLGNVG